MRALVYDAFAAAPELREVAAPDCPNGGAVIRVEATGLCRSDWHGWQGHDPDIVLPHVPGHEFAGTIAAIDPAVPGWRVGDRVTVPFVCACGSCPPCLRGDGQVCDRQTQPGFTHWGSFAELVAVEQAAVNLIRVPAALSSIAAAALGCRFATAYRAVLGQGRVGPGDLVAVHGCGGVGLSAVMIAGAYGARVVAVDIAADALALATELGACWTIDSRTVGGDVPGRIRELTGGGADVSLDALGSGQTWADSIGCLRKRGRHVQVGLLAGAEADPRIDGAALVGRELEIVGSHGMAAADYPAMLADIAAGRLDPARLVHRVIGLADVAAAWTGADAGGSAGTTVIVP